MQKNTIRKTIELLDAIKNIAIGALPVIPGEKKFGLGSIFSEEVTAALAGKMPGARVERVELEPDSKGTTDRGRLLLRWNEAGKAAGLPQTLFAKGTPSTPSSRILNSAFGLCEFEVRFYNELYPSVADITLTPYAARFRTGGRFVIAMEDLGKEAHFFQPGDEPPLSHAEAIVDVLARLHAQFWRSPRFERDLAWVTPYSGRPGFVLANKVLIKFEKQWLREKEDAPASVKRLTRFFVENRDVMDRAWESLPYTLCHGDPHLGNTYARNDGSAGVYDWQNMHRMNGMRDVAYFIGHALPIEMRRAEEKNLIRRYLDGLAAGGVGSEVPSFEQAFDQYRLLMMDAWTSVWASLAIGGMVEEWRGEILLKRFYAVLEDLDTEQALKDVV